MTIEELRELCALTVELTKLRQNECKHLCIENFAPDLLGKLIREHSAATAKATTNWAEDALKLMDEADALVRWCSCNAPAERYTPAAKAFWDVCHMLAAERDRLHEAMTQNASGKPTPRSGGRP